MNKRGGFVTILALFFLMLLSAVLIFQMQGYRRQIETYDTLIEHYQHKIQHQKR